MFDKGSSRRPERSGEMPDEIKLVAVSKTHPAETVRDAIAAGITVFGENKVQEAEGKIVEIGRNAAEWHLIGHLQSNKARRAVQLFDVIHSVDSLELAEAWSVFVLKRAARSFRFLFRSILAGEETKSGIPESDLPELAAYLKTCKCLRFNGLMLLPPFFDEAEATRPFFKRLRAIRDDLACKTRLQMAAASFRWE